MFGLGSLEIIVILVVALLIFGPKSLPKIGQALGRGMREFKDAANGMIKAIEDDPDSKDASAQKQHSATSYSSKPNDANQTGDASPDQKKV
ncbi:twin-arginine translocase TatA/TatE family subunit [Candidatus Sumerlaeota bacterium]|nr:twin-arginine translocase TatA/TatE family subunit [Candidatus Sumerlaeota bacterium]